MTKMRINKILIVLIVALTYQKLIGQSKVWTLEECIELAIEKNISRNILKNWDYKLTPNSIEASIYVFWENKIKEKARNTFVPKKATNIQ